MGPFDYFNNLNLDLLESQYSQIDPVTPISDQLKPIGIKPLTPQSEIELKEPTNYLDINLDNFTSTSNNSEASLATKFLGEKGSGNIAQEGLGFAKNMATTFGKRSSGTAEDIMNGVNNTMQGAKLGMQIGGPWGAAAGAAFGAGATIVDAISDGNKARKERIDENRKERRKNLTKRERDYNLRKGEESVSRLKMLRESQMNYISLNGY